MPHGRREQDRAAIALPPLDAAARRCAERQVWHLDLVDPADPDERSMLIRLAHPDLDDAIKRGSETVVLGGEPIDPRLHLAIHEVVAAQIMDDDPPEAVQTALRLLALGRDHHEVLHMLGFCVSGRLWAALHEGRAYDREAHAAALAALPESFDREFAPVAANRAARREAARRARGGAEPQRTERRTRRADSAGGEDAAAIGVRDSTTRGARSARGYAASPSL